MFYALVVVVAMMLGLCGPRILNVSELPSPVPYDQEVPTQQQPIHANPLDR